jgi:hypothetical protein
VIKFIKFNIQPSTVCKKRDYLFLEPLVKYDKMWLCGKRKPSNDFVSTKKYMTLKFKSNAKTTAKGFQVSLTAKVFRAGELERMLSLNSTNSSFQNSTKKIQDKNLNNYD